MTQRYGKTSWPATIPGAIWLDVARARFHVISNSPVGCKVVDCEGLAEVRFFGGPMRRREFFGFISSALAALPFAARAQQAAVPVVGFLHGGSAVVFARQVKAFQDGLREAGFVEGQNVVIEYRWAEGSFEKLPALADELVRRHANVIAAIGGDIVARAAMRATSAVPVVFMVGQDVIRSGLVASLNRPGGNATGVTLFVPLLVPKQMELLHLIVPGAAVIAILINPDNPSVLPDLPDLEQAARANGMELVLLNATTSEQIDTAFTAAANQRAGALLVPGDVFFTGQREQIIRLAEQHALPAIYPFRENVAAGGLVSYGNNLNETAALAAGYVARLLRGEKAADLPVIQPTKFELVLNLKTAKSLGLDIPAKVLALADEVIE
jgi:putative tryptophan/tyrosine transport system substrate-binding protein